MFIDGKSIMFLVAVFIIVLLCLKERKRKKQIQNIVSGISHILKCNSSEKIMTFTDDKEIQKLTEQINGLLENEQQIKADYIRSQSEIKKMLANVSHDIKTPMTVIMGYLEIMISKQEDEELLKVQKKAGEVLELINKFFTLAKLESGDMDFVFEEININELCREIILDYYDILTEQEFVVDIQIPNEARYVNSSREALERIINNLITNILRYGLDGKYLGLSVKANDSSVYVEVMDKGKGIDKHNLSHVFDRMYTMEDSRNKNIQGNGLGLAIAKGLAMRLGGNISVESEPYKKTVFILELKC